MTDRPRLRVPGARALAWTIAGALLPACASNAPQPTRADAGDRIKAAFVVLGPGGAPIARVITTSAGCPDLEVDGARVAMVVRAAPATEVLRPTLSAPSDSKPLSVIRSPPRSERVLSFVKFCT